MTVISPQNDGESRTIVDICKRLNMDLRISTQPWGATLDQEPPEHLQNLKRVVVVVEMPSLTLESKLRDQGHQVEIVDHHYYPKIGLDRRQPLSSLEQVANLLDYNLTRWEMGIAINDRNYIFGLLDAGYSFDEILEIRKFDLEAQGVPPENIVKVREALKTAPVKKGITILRLDFPSAGYAQDFLVLETPDQVRDLLILTGNPVRKAQFYGDPVKIQKLAEIGEWMGGGDKSKFWGTNHPDVQEIFRRLNIED
ncbi:MAG: hypothetical protein C5B54_00465 [Acidobacteria bacterium]|nr:MAG: hypothetical protein C5B54_00465 [Acidobacteriota bacterium]